jgi:hypothetical protein
MAAEYNEDRYRQLDIATTGTSAAPGSGVARNDKEAAGLQDSHAEHPHQISGSAFNPSRTPPPVEEPPLPDTHPGMTAFEMASNAIKAQEPPILDAAEVDRFARGVDS